jgi:ribosomal protein S18 acetylase RimI-like enzyme
MDVETAPDPASVQLVEELLYDFNERATGHVDGERLSIFLRDAAGAVVGGVHGWSWGGTGYVRLLFVPLAMRGRGHGSALMDAFEAEVRRRGCTQVVLETHDFQAPEFYRARGFAVVGVVENYPRGFRYLTLVKPLAQ